MVTSTVLDVSPGAGVLQNDFDPDADPTVAVLVARPSSGSLSFNSDGSFQYTPAAGFNGMGGLPSNKNVRLRALYDAVCAVHRGNENGRHFFRHRVFVLRIHDYVAGAGAR